MRMRRDLEGRLALVTGASSGLGLASARALARRGARVVLSSRGGDKLQAARERLAASGAEVSCRAADVGDPDALRDLVEWIEREHGGVDVLVANGGGPAAKPALELTDEDWHEAIGPVLLFVPRLCRLTVPAMRDRGWGRVVAINSVSARQPIPNLALSNTLRPAVLGYLKTLSQEVASDGVTVNAVLPGYTMTERQAELLRAAAERSGRSADDIRDEWADHAAAKRLAQPDEIGRVVGFLCSNEASYVTGQAWSVDGGYVKGLL
jgi:3-oxoacyl-[acyl-carrier protein] reductase